MGPVRANQEVPRQILRQTWSALNVPLMWAASSGDEECPVLLWLARAGEQVKSLTACDATWNGREAVLAGWGALARAMRAWRVHSLEDLSEWIHRQGFPQPRWRNHFSGRAREVLTIAAMMLQAMYIRSNLRLTLSHKHGLYCFCFVVDKSMLSSGHSSLCFQLVLFR